MKFSQVSKALLLASMTLVGSIAARGGSVVNDTLDITPKLVETPFVSIPEVSISQASQKNMFDDLKIQYDRVVTPSSVDQITDRDNKLEYIHDEIGGASVSYTTNSDAGSDTITIAHLRAGVCLNRSIGERIENILQGLYTNRRRIVAGGNLNNAYRIAAKVAKIVTLIGTEANAVKLGVILPSTIAGEETDTATRMQYYRPNNMAFATLASQLNDYYGKTLRANDLGAAGGSNADNRNAFILEEWLDACLEESDLHNNAIWWAYAVAVGVNDSGSDEIEGDWLDITKSADVTENSKTITLDKADLVRKMYSLVMLLSDSVISRMDSDAKDEILSMTKRMHNNAKGSNLVDPEWGLVEAVGLERAKEMQLHLRKLYVAAGGDPTGGSPDNLRNKLYTTV